MRDPIWRGRNASWALEVFQENGFEADGHLVIAGHGERCRTGRGSEGIEWALNKRCLPCIPNSEHCGTAGAGQLTSVDCVVGRCSRRCPSRVGRVRRRASNCRPADTRLRARTEQVPGVNRVPMLGSSQHTNRSAICPWTSGAGSLAPRRPRAGWGRLSPRRLVAPASLGVPHGLAGEAVFGHYRAQSGSHGGGNGFGDVIRGSG